MTSSCRSCTTSMEMIIPIEEQHGDEQLCAFKLDLAGAFHLLVLSVPSSLLM